MKKKIVPELQKTHREYKMNNLICMILMSLLNINMSVHSFVLSNDWVDATACAPKAINGIHQPRSHIFIINILLKCFK